MAGLQGPAVSDMFRVGNVVDTLDVVAWRMPVVWYVLIVRHLKFEIFHVCEG